MGRLTTVLSFWSVLIVLLPPRTTTFAEGQGDCILNFTQQPVTGIDCEVYQEPVIVLTCSVESLSQQAFPDPSLIEIRWYFYNGTEYELTTGVGHTRTGGNGDHVQVTSTLNVSGTSNQQFAFLGEGFYYCQVHMTDITVVTNFSQRFQVCGRDEYVQAGYSCRERTFIANVESCAAYHADVITEITQTTPQTSDKHNGSITTVEPSNAKTDTSTPSPGQPITSDEYQRRESVWTYVLAGVVVAFFTIIVILTVLLSLTLYRRQSRHGIAQDNNEANTGNTTIPMNLNPVYNTNTDGTGNVVMQTCDAYEATKHSETKEDTTYYYESIEDV